MLDVIADFWKPVKKIQQQERLQEEQLQVGSSIGFGFVPQAILNGRRLTVSAINTYQFGAENLTSYVLSQDREPSVSMIVAEADGEQYLAISRRIPLEERGRLFDSMDLESCLTNPDATRLACKDNVADFKAWLVSSYKREINGLKGRIYKGDHRRIPLPATTEGQDFTYTLLVSDSNEHALEIEKYFDGRIEVYATIYRRINDVGEISHPVGEMVLRPEVRPEVRQEAKPDIKLATKRDDVAPVAAVTPASTALLEPVVVPKPLENKAATEAATELKVTAPEAKVADTAAKAADVKTQEPKAETAKADVNAEAAKLQPAPVEAPKAEVKAQAAAPKPEAKPVAVAAKPAASSITVHAAEPVVGKPEAVVETAKAENQIEAKTEPHAAKAQPAASPVATVAKPEEAKHTVKQPEVQPEVAKPAAAATNTQKENTMSNEAAAAVNGINHAEASKPTLYVNNTAPEGQQSVKAVSRQGQFENDSIECDLRVANKLIDEAIRNEMRLNDVVRRVIELPVANPESVQIPVTLTDEDYALLAIRYGIPAADRNAIKRRIIQDLNDFSGEAKA